MGGFGYIMLWLAFFLFFGSFKIPLLILWICGLLCVDCSQHLYFLESNRLLEDIFAWTRRSYSEYSDISGTSNISLGILMAVVVFIPRFLLFSST